VQVPSPFDLEFVVRSHGWYDLPPWSWDGKRKVLARPLLLAGGRVALAELAERAEPGGGLALRLSAAGRLGVAQAEEARAQLRTALALDLDLGPFWRRLQDLEPERRRRRLPDLRWAVRCGAGRLLRSPTVFEDVVKMLCTTNCTWALTRVMVRNLVERLGPEGPGGARAFPAPEALAARSERFFRERVRAGYRAPHLVAIARAVARRALDLEAWRDAALPDEELRARILELPGFGPYASEGLLRLLGRHRHLALDSWTRARFRELRGMRRPPADRTIARAYAPYGEWGGLAMWLELTADWFGERPSWPA
jgi:N-glycosylase/DNA lyase